MAQTLTPKEIAIKWDSDARTVRKFLRTAEGTGKVGQGNRHAIDTKSVTKMHKAFDAWNAARTAKSTESPIADEVLDDTIEDEVTETE